MHCIAHSKLSPPHMLCCVPSCRLVSQLQPFAGMQHLDVAGGTGDIAFRVLQRMREAEADAGASAPQQQVHAIQITQTAGLAAQACGHPYITRIRPGTVRQLCAGCQRYVVAMHPSVLAAACRGL